MADGIQQQSDHSSDSLPKNQSSSNVKPKVSFNRDVHVKRIGSRGSADIVPALTAVDKNESERLLAVLPVRREKLGHLSRRQLADEAAKVLRQADSVHCISNQAGDVEKFYSLPSRKKNRPPILLTERRRSIENPQLPPEKPPRTFEGTPTRPKRTKSKKLSSFFNKVKRTKSDASGTKPSVKITRSRSDVSEFPNDRRVPLSPIIEASPSVEVEVKDYFDVKPTEMIHSSQKPVDRLPLTKGNTVDHMVKRLSHERFSPPPTPQRVLVTPTQNLQHNNNQPFSYTPSPKELIYAQVVCGPDSKETKNYYAEKHSDSDEGIEIIRGRGDGMDETKRSLTDLYDLSSRRELLESRINSRMNRLSPQKMSHKSNPELIAQKRYEDVLEISTTRRYNDPLNKSDLKIDRNHSNSEDEGFQSSLLISTERQQTEETPQQKKITTEYHTQRSEHRRHIYEYQRTPPDSDPDDYVKPERKIKSSDYVPRERSIDDGSHFDPRIDKMPEKKVLTKPPKPSGLDKVKNLFSSKKMKEKRAAKAAMMVDEKEMRARYSEYKGSQENLDPKQEVDYSKRKKLTTPRSSPIPPKSTTSPTNGTLTRRPKSEASWFKSIDRLTRPKKKPIVDETDSTLKPQPKNLRFFGDTTDSEGEKHRTVRPKPTGGYTSRTPTRISPPSRGDTLKRLRRNDSLHEASTDSSQQSQRSVVYLHAATVGDIPGPHHRSSSRDELSSLSSSRITTPQVKTLSRSFSVLAPWKPRHYRDTYDIDYSQPRSKTSTSTSVKSKIESKNGKLGDTHRRTRSKENISATTLNRKDMYQKKSSKSMDSLGMKGDKSKVSRSVSMPKEKQAGWFGKK